MLAHILGFAAVLLISGCGLFMRLYEPNPRIPAVEQRLPEAYPQLKAQVTTDGSLWQSDTVSIWADDKAYRRGDIVLVKVSHKAEGAQNAKTDTKRTSSIKATISKFLGFEDNIIEATTGTPDLLDATSSNSFKGEGSTERKDDLQATISCLVLDVLDNGNIVIKGHQIVQVNYESSILSVQGLIRTSDIGPDNTIDSTRIANARIEFDGSGVVSDKQHPGIAMRLFDAVWPF